MGMRETLIVRCESAEKVDESVTQDEAAQNPRIQCDRLFF
jgi:hypothetical protein